VIVNRLGLHARAAARLVREATNYESEITVSRAGQRADAKSIMGIMMLAASQGTELELAVHGVDEELALQSIVDLIEKRFGEDD